MNQISHTGHINSWKEIIKCQSAKDILFSNGIDLYKIQNVELETSSSSLIRSICYAYFTNNEKNQTEHDSSQKYKLLDKLSFCLFYTNIFL